MNNKVISVIIPVYNREQYLDNCIKSVLDQEDVSTNIILIDDGSTDSSPGMCDEYAKRHSNISVIHTTNHGVGHARNLGLDIATGDYIMFLDSDDRYAPGALSAMQKALEDNEADFVVGGYEAFSDHGKSLFKAPVPKSYANRLVDCDTFADFLGERDSSLIAINIPLKLFKKKIWMDLRFREDIRTSEDDFLLPVILERTSRVFILDSIVYYQTLSECSLVRSAPSMNLLNATKSRLVSFDYLLSKGKYNVALYRFGDGTRRLLEAKKLLSSKEAKLEIKRQYKGYCEASKKLAPYVSIKNKIRFVLFRTNLDFYDLIRRINSK